METKIFTTAEITAAATALKSGELVAFPTETVYGLGADALNEEAVKKVYAAKGRPSDNPLIVHVADLASVEKFVGTLPADFLTLAKAFWPGPLTMILPILAGSLSKAVTGGLTTCAFRMPDNAPTLALIKESGTVLVGPSANTSGKPSPTTAQHVYHDLKDKVAGILDDGPTRVGVESTVLDLSDLQRPTILRPGAITQGQIAAVLDKPVFLDGHLVKADETPKAPGMKYKHYSPNAEVYMMPFTATVADWQQAIASFPRQKVGVLANAELLSKLPAGPQFPLGEKADVRSGNRFLFAGLRQLDEEAEVILVETFPATEKSAAYLNRLGKASGGKTYQK
ncbi:L-threonylcarbamoyladenylate synthase [Enterococcus nangangensis]